MSKRFLFLPLLLAASSAHAESQEVRQCESEVKPRCVSGDASVTLADGVVKKIEINVFWCGHPGHPGYSCTLDSSRGDTDSKWSEETGATIIANASPFNPDLPDRAKVTVGRFVSIDLEQAQSAGRCGAGAELPRAIVIPAEKKKACRVWLGR
jgi:hypothetical protein